MVGKKRKLNPRESAILRVLIQNGGFMTTAEISKEADISWNTALFYLNVFHKKGWIEKQGKKVLYWRAIYDYT